MKAITRKLGWAAAAALIFSPAVKAQELRIGFVAPMTGIFAQIGKDMENGFQMYLDEQNGNFAGAKVTFIVEDEEGKPPVGVRKAEKLARQDRVHMLVGGLLASTGYAIAPVSTRLKTVYVLSISAADDLTQRTFLACVEGRDTLATLPPGVAWGDDDVTRIERDGQARLWWDRTPVDVFFNTNASLPGADDRRGDLALWGAPRIVALD